MRIEIPEAGDNPTWLEDLSESALRGFAMRVSRRSFLGRLGRGAIAASLGAAAGSLLLAEDALSHAPPPGCSGCAVTCAQLTGQNECPGSTSVCGCWCISGAGCANYKKWCDCCGDAYCQGRRQCVNGAPSCYNHRAYSSTGDTHIACRRWRCTSASNCERFVNPCN